MTNSASSRTTTRTIRHPAPAVRTQSSMRRIETVPSPPLSYSIRRSERGGRCDLCVGNINEAVIHVSLCYTHRFCVKLTDSQISQIWIFTHICERFQKSVRYFVLKKSLPKISRKKSPFFRCGETANFPATSR
jgi:hypothetical protein